jgi:hypothetical protein
LGGGGSEEDEEEGRRSERDGDWFRSVGGFGGGGEVVVGGVEVGGGRVGGGNEPGVFVPPSVIGNTKSRAELGGEVEVTAN